jgi:hypothetical protein
MWGILVFATVFFATLLFALVYLVLSGKVSVYAPNNIPIADADELAMTP